MRRQRLTIAIIIGNGISAFGGLLALDTFATFYKVNLTLEVLGDNNRVLSRLQVAVRGVVRSCDLRESCAQIRPTHLLMRLHELELQGFDLLVFLLLQSFQLQS